MGLCYLLFPLFGLHRRSLSGFSTFTFKKWVLFIGMFLVVFLAGLFISYLFFTVFV
jgi:hypothetical protein